MIDNEKCSQCQEGKTPPQVPFIAFEAAEARAERNIKRMQILCGIMAALIVFTNGAWILHYIGIF